MIPMPGEVMRFADPGSLEHLIGTAVVLSAIAVRVGYRWGTYGDRGPEEPLVLGALAFGGFFWPLMYGLLFLVVPAATAGLVMFYTGRALRKIRLPRKAPAPPTLGIPDPYLKKASAEVEAMLADDAKWKNLTARAVSEEATDV